MEIGKRQSRIANRETSVKQRGGDIELLKATAKEESAQIQELLKGLGYMKLGERLRITSVLKAAARVGAPTKWKPT